jgi:hypothetical protein
VRALARAPIGGAVLVLITLLAPARWSDTSAAHWPHLEPLREILTGNPELAESRLGRLGPSAAPTLWAIYSGQALAGLELERGALEALLRATLVRWPGSATVDELLAAGREDTPLAERLLLVELVGWTESERALRGIFELLAEVPPVLLHSTRVAGSLRRALTPVLRAEPRLCRDLAGLLPELPRELLPSVVDTAAEIGSRDALFVLTRAARMGPEPARRALAAISLRELPLSAEGAQDCIELAREHLRADDPRTRCLAMSALGRLHDVGSFELLCEALEDEDPVNGRVALEALQELSGLTRSWNAEQWLRWWESESLWLEGIEELGADLASDDRHLSKSALRSLSNHRLFAERAASVLAEGLRHPDEEVRVLACDGLLRLAHPAAIPHLIEALTDASDEVCGSAQQALVELTHQDHGLDWGPWNSWWRSLQ